MSPKNHLISSNLSINLLINVWFSRKSNGDHPSEDLRDGFRELRKEFRALQGEWDVTYDKIRILMGRISKRAAIIREDTAEEQEEPAPSSTPEQVPSGPAWTVNMHKAQAQILARRARGLPGS